MKLVSGSLSNQTQKAPRGAPNVVRRRSTRAGTWLTTAPEMSRPAGKLAQAGGLIDALKSVCPD